MRPLIALVVLALVASSCGGSAAPAPAATAPPTAAPSLAPTADPTTAAATAPAPGGPAFLTAPLTDVRSGETFSIGGFPGKVVLVIAMAVW